MVLVEDMVSRRHARILTHNGEVVIEDLESTNGTFVNGEKVQQAQLKEGDRILIGTSILKLTSDEGKVTLSESDARHRLELANARRATNSALRPIAGSIDEIPLPDLMQLLSTSRKTGVLALSGPHGSGHIHFRKGQIYFATFNDSFDIPPRKAIFRLLGWDSGTFELNPADEQQVLDEIEDSTEMLLMEGLRQLDEVRRLGKQMPSPQALLALANPMGPRLHALSPDELDVLQAAHNQRRLNAVLDHAPGTDLEILHVVRKLLDLGYLEVQ